MSLSATVLMGVVGATVMYVGARQILSGGTHDAGRLHDLHRVPGIPGGAHVPGGGHRHADHRGAGRPGPHPGSACASSRRTRTRSARNAIGAISGDVAFEHVSFAYDPGKPVLHDVSFESQPGTVTALVGPSGSGKSTIISLIAAFHEPTEGVVRVDGVDLSTRAAGRLPHAARRGVAGHLPVRRHHPRERGFRPPGATEEQILEACRIARVDEFAERFEKKYDTIVGERGVKLSGGQRQRVSIARAILANPRILILDEATSSLDSESEAAIQEGLAYLMKGRTTFVIAHRLSTIRRADQILVVEDGRIVERGTHESLYALARPLLRPVHPPARPRRQPVPGPRRVRSRAGKWRQAAGRTAGLHRPARPRSCAAELPKTADNAAKPPRRGGLLETD